MSNRLPALTAATLAIVAAGMPVRAERCALIRLEAVAPPPAPKPLPLPSTPGAVVELLEDEGEWLATHLTNHPGHEPGTATPEFKDRYSGISALRVTQFQRYSHVIAGWTFPVAEKPKPGEFRYVRFAWKKVGGTGIMLQLCGDEYRAIHRYHAGQNGGGWQSTQLRQTIPEQWEVVTRDLYKDFGAFTLMGMAFSPFDGDGGLFDHIYLGRTLEDLDKVAPLAKPQPPAEAATKDRLAAWWADLAADDCAVSTAARWRFSGDGRCVGFLREQLIPKAPDDDVVARLIRDLDHPRFVVRENATRRLAELGRAVVPALERHLRTRPSTEVAERIGRVLKRDAGAGFTWTPDRLRTLRAMRALEQVGTADARALLADLAVGHSENPLVSAAQSALKRR